MQRTRIYGEGEVRIGQTIDLNADIYSIGFICQMRNDLMEEFLDINTTK